MISKYKKTFEPVIAIIAGPFVSFHPNLLTAIGVLPPIFFCIFLYLHWYGWAFISLFGLLFDAIDGYVARKTGKTSLFGGVFDSFIDRISDFFIIAAFGYAALVPWELVVPVFVTSFFISYLRAIGERAIAKAQNIDNGIMQRTERLSLLIIAFLSIIFFPHLSFIPIGIFLTILFFNIITIIMRLLTIASVLKP